MHMDCYKILKGSWISYMLTCNATHRHDIVHVNTADHEYQYNIDRLTLDTDHVYQMCQLKACML